MSISLENNVVMRKNGKKGKENVLKRNCVPIMSKMMYFSQENMKKRNVDLIIIRKL